MDNNVFAPSQNPISSSGTTNGQPTTVGNANGYGTVNLFGNTGAMGINGALPSVPGLTEKNQYNVYDQAYNSSNYASNTMAAIARQDYGQYQQYFQPLEGVLAGMVGNQQYDTSQVGTALGNFNNQFDASAGGQNQRDLSRYGLTMNSQQQQSYNRLQSESKSLGQVNAVNSTNRAIGQNENSILYGGVNSPTSQLLQQLPANALPH